MSGDLPYHFCEYRDCGKVAVLALKAHSRDERLLDYPMHYVCSSHWYEPVRDTVRAMLREETVFGLSIVLP